jgi:hypothetical protein
VTEDQLASRTTSATVMAATLALFARRVKVGSRGVETGRAPSAGVEELAPIPPPISRL